MTKRPIVKSRTVPEARSEVVEKGTRNGYSSAAAPRIGIFKRKDFARWQSREKLPDAALREAVREMEGGLVDANLGGLLFKKRVPRRDGGKSGGYRTVLAARIGRRYVFLHGFAKSAKANITDDERKALQYVGRVFLDMDAEDLARALASGVLLEVDCGEEQDH